MSALLGCVVDPDAMVMDLTPPETRMERAMERRRRQLNVMGFLALFIVCLIGALLFIGYYGRHLELTQLQASVANERPRAQDVTVKTARIQVLRQRVDATGTPLNLLAEVYRVTPQSISLTSIALKNRKGVVLRGRGAMMSDVMSYVSTLEKSPLPVIAPPGPCVRSVRLI